MQNICIFVIGCFFSRFLRIRFKSTTWICVIESNKYNSTNPFFILISGICNMSHPIGKIYPIWNEAKNTYAHKDHKRISHQEISLNSCRCIIWLIIFIILDLMYFQSIEKWKSTGGSCEDKKCYWMKLSTYVSFHFTILTWKEDSDFPIFTCHWRMDDLIRRNQEKDSNQIRYCFSDLSHKYKSIREEWILIYFDSNHVQPHPKLFSYT